jgi:hypothetical protein
MLRKPKKKARKEMPAKAQMQGCLEAKDEI